MIAICMFLVICDLLSESFYLKLATTCKNLFLSLIVARLVIFLNTSLEVLTKYVYRKTPLLSVFSVKYQTFMHLTFFMHYIWHCNISNILHSYMATFACTKTDSTSTHQWTVDTWSIIELGAHCTLIVSYWQAQCNSFQLQLRWLG